ncbi:hypothetical protein ALQ88_200085 [Pseudomonas savastanoi]|nr:hypothetical protein ALQ88_200085 [Pseudomonas savastanoi]
MIQQASTLAHIRSLQAQRYAAMQQADQDAFARPCALVYVHSNCVQDALARYLAGKNAAMGCTCITTSSVRSTRSGYTTTPSWSLAKCRRASPHMASTSRFTTETSASG